MWRGDSLSAAKAHLLEASAEGPFAHHPFEAPRAEFGEGKPMSQIARRIMLPADGGRVTVSAYATARKRLYARLDPLVANLQARGGKLRASRG